MKILFLMRNSIYLRSYESVAHALARKGHEVHMVFNSIKAIYPQATIEDLVRRHAGVRYSVIPNHVWLWQRPVDFVRVLQTYLRYLDPHHRDATKFRARAARLLPRPVRWLLRTTCDQNRERIWKVIGVLRAVERAIPLDPSIVKFFQLEKPDLFLVTPLINLHASQVDWLKCAKARGIKSVLGVASWDNLSNKSLIQMEPDAVFVWNEIQKQELEQLHRISRSRIVVTGAQCFDRLFAHRPSATRQEFLNQVGLKVGCDYLLYVCSSRFIAPDEVGFVKEWLTRIRAAGSTLSAIGVLIRPHPQHAEQWDGIDLSAYGNVTIYPRAGANPVRGKNFDEFYNSMFYSRATVGINTSSMIESGILNKPVFTIMTAGFRATQDESIHFHYLVDGGLVYVSHALDEHVEQLSRVLEGKDSREQALRDFVRSFVRPHGLDVECTPLFVRALEELHENGRSSGYERARWLGLVRAALLPWAVLSYLRSRLGLLLRRCLPARA